MRKTYKSLLMTFLIGNFYLTQASDTKTCSEKFKECWQAFTHLLEKKHARRSACNNPEIAENLNSHMHCMQKQQSSMVYTSNNTAEYVDQGSVGSCPPRDQQTKHHFHSPTNSVHSPTPSESYEMCSNQGDSEAENQQLGWLGTWFQN